MSWRALDPSPFGGWIRWTPRSWPGWDRAAFDLAERKIVWPGNDSRGDRGLPRSLPPEPGVVYLPPVDDGDVAAAAALGCRLLEEGFALAAHEALVGLPEDGRVARWTDPIADWLDGASPEQWRRTRGAAPEAPNVALPLIAGLTPVGEREAWLAAFAAEGVRAAVPVRAELSPADRRRVVDRLGETVFDEVFHGEVPSERALAVRVAAQGLSPLPPPPAVSGGSPRSRRNRDLAHALSEAAELALRLEAPESECAALFAAARHLESTALDVVALGREGNLPVLDWLAPPAREMVAELAIRGASERLERWRRRWRGEDAA